MISHKGTVTAIQIKSVSVLSAFFLGGPDLGPTGCFKGPLTPPNRLLAIVCLALSSGATNFFFYFAGGSLATNTGDLTYLAS